MQKSSEIPFIEIRKPRSYKPLDAALKNLHEYDWLILTSVNGVEALWQRLNKLRLTKRQLKHLKIAAIGPATRKAIEKHGLKVNVVPEQYVAESVVEALRNEVAGKRVLLARARVARDMIPRELRKLGARVDVVEAYETVIPQSSRTRLRVDPERLKAPSASDYVYEFVDGQKLRRPAGKKDNARRHTPGFDRTNNLCDASRTWPAGRRRGHRIHNSRADQGPIWFGTGSLTRLPPA